jgi:hypothetical protein
MNNDQVIQSLRDLIALLSTRLQELVQLQADPGGPFFELLDRQARVAERISSLNLRIFHLQNRLNERSLAEQIGRVVTPIDGARVAAIQSALQDVSRSIAMAATFQEAIVLATTISEAASNAHAQTAI